MHHGYSWPDGGVCDQIVRLPARLPPGITVVSRWPEARGAELFVLPAGRPIVYHRVAAVVVLGDRVAIEHGEQPRRARGAVTWGVQALRTARRDRADVAVASHDHLDELLGQVRTALADTRAATVIPLNRDRTR